MDILTVQELVARIGFFIHVYVIWLSTNYSNKVDCGWLQDLKHVYVYHAKTYFLTQLDGSNGCRITNGLFPDMVWIIIIIFLTLGTVLSSIEHVIVRLRLCLMIFYVISHKFL